MRGRFVSWVGAALLLGTWADGSFATHISGTFELGDGTNRTGSADILGSAAQPGCDWADLFDGDPTPAEVAAAVAACHGVGAAFVSDPFGSVDTTSFTKGSSKNDAPISNWQWSTGSSPGKDDIANFYTYGTLNANNELLIYAGIERLAASGDSHVDFEFNQSALALDKPPPCGSDGSAGPTDGAPCEFTGARTPGDILVVMDFLRGGSLGFVELRRWDGASWILADSVGGEGCDGADNLCSFNNGIAIDGGPWKNYDEKGNVVTMLQKNAFTEVGLNVTRLLGSTPCFVSVTTKSRTSSSFTSALKDFAQASFGICSISIDKSGASNNPDPIRSKNGDAFTFRYDITNTGAATLYLIQVTDSFLGDITPQALAGGGLPAATDATSGGCGTLAAGQSCSFGIASAVPDTAPDPFSSRVSTSYGTSASSLAAVDSVVVSASDDDVFDLNLFQPSVDVQKTGDTLSTAGNTAAYTITVTNTSSSDSPNLTNGVISDTLLGNLLDPVNPFVTSNSCAAILPTGPSPTSCQIAAARTVLSTDPDPLPNTVTATYNPAGVTPAVSFPNVITDNAYHAVDLFHPNESLTVTGFPDAGAQGDLITYTFVVANTGDSNLLRVSVVDSLLGDLTALFPASLAPGQTVTITVTRAIQPGDPDPIVNTVTVIYQVEGLTNLVTRTASFSVDIVVPCAKSPGFWKGGEGVPKWDSLATDKIAQKAGFQTTTVFPWLDPSLFGTSYLGVLQFSSLGDVTRQLGFKYVAARLNEAAFGIRSSTAADLDQCDVYFAAHPVGSDPQGAAIAEGQSLLDRLNAYFTEVGESQCPPNDQF